MPLTLETITMTPDRYKEIYAIHEKYCQEHPEDMMGKGVYNIVAEEAEGVFSWLPDRYGEGFAQKLGLTLPEVYEYSFIRATVETQEFYDRFGLTKAEPPN